MKFAAIGALVASAAARDAFYLAETRLSDDPSTPAPAAAADAEYKKFLEANQHCTAALKAKCAAEETKIAELNAADGATPAAYKAAVDCFKRERMNAKGMTFVSASIA